MFILSKRIYNRKEQKWWCWWFGDGEDVWVVLPLNGKLSHLTTEKQLWPDWVSFGLGLLYGLSGWLDAKPNKLTSEVKGSRSVVSDSFEIPWTVAYQDPQSMGFSRQEYQSGLPIRSKLPFEREIMAAESEFSLSLGMYGQAQEYILFVDGFL